MKASSNNDKPSPTKPQIPLTNNAVEPAPQALRFKEIERLRRLVEGPLPLWPTPVKGKKQLT